MASNPTDNLQQLIERANKGDDSAIAMLYQQNVDRIFRYVSYRVPSTDAEDITADVFVRMVESLPDFIYTGAPFESWLYRIASARIADYHRKSNRQITDEIQEDVTDERPLPEDGMLEQQDFQEMRSALSGLADDEQTLLIMRFVERKNHKEVAEIMGKSVAAVRTMQHRALTKLAQIMDATGKARHYLRGDKSDDD